MKVYLSGPMTGLPQNNYPAFFSAETVLVARGYQVINPARIAPPSPPTWENYMRRAIAQLCECGLVCQLSGWGRSRGAWLEHLIAWELGIDCALFEELLARPPLGIMGVSNG